MGPQDHQDPQDLKTYGTLRILGTSGPKDPRQILSTAWTLEAKHPETLKLKHKQKKLYNWTITKQNGKLPVPFWGFFNLSSC